tara:strand:- start:5189 stop:5800 length:612 start_codon:yes stop_codon:yes gene_type:complete
MKIFITPNIKKYHKTYIDFLDHYWVNFFKKNNIEYVSLNSDIKNSLKLFNVFNDKKKLLILTGGSDIGKKSYESIRRDNLEKRLIKLALKKKIPILGICRGAQLFSKINGFDLIKVKKHMKTNHYVKFKKNFLNYKNKEKVNSFHTYAIKEKKKKNFEIIAQDYQNLVELYSYKKKNLFFMWHPERNKNYKELKKIIKFFYED